MVGDGHAMGVAAARLREHCNDHRLHPVPSDPDCIACGGCTFIVQFPARTSRGSDMSASAPTPKPSETKTKITRKLTVSTKVKRLVAAAGATIIFLTFLVNDAKRENMKELVGSIEAAENAFQIQTDSRRTYLEVRQFEKDFAESRGQHPLKKPAPHIDPMSGIEFDTVVSNKEIDWNTLNVIEEYQPFVDELLGHISKLAERLPRTRNRSRDVDALKHVNSNLKLGWNDLFSKANSVDDMLGSKEGATKVEQLNLEIDGLGQAFIKDSDDVEKESRSILDEAERERAATEENYRFWTIVFRIMYVFGWVVGIAGILIGANEDAVVEGLKGD